MTSAKDQIYNLLELHIFFASEIFFGTVTSSKCPIFHSFPFNDFNFALAEPERILLNCETEEGQFLLYINTILQNLLELIAWAESSNTTRWSLDQMDAVTVSFLGETSANNL